MYYDTYNGYIYVREIVNDTKGCIELIQELFKDEFANITFPQTSSEGEKVTIGKNAFQYACVKIKFPPNMDTISDYCFTSSLLIDLEIPSTIKKIGNYAFSRANFKQFPTENLNRDLEFGKSSFAFTAIEEFTIPSGISYINPGLFSSCQYLTTIRIPQVDYIGSYAFFNCSKLEHVSISYGCKEIQDFAFSKSGIETISFPPSITEIGNNAFSDCINLNISSLPESLTSVQYQTFSNCTNITSIDLRNVASINSLAFHLCINLVEIIIPRYCKTIGSYAFGSCISLCSVVINKGCLTNSFAFNNCTSLSLVVLKETSAIKNYAFSNCSSIRNVVLSEKKT